MPLCVLAWLGPSILGLTVLPCSPQASFAPRFSFPHLYLFPHLKQRRGKRGEAAIANPRVIASGEVRVGLNTCYIRALLAPTTERRDKPKGRDGGGHEEAMVRSGSLAGERKSHGEALSLVTE